ncbi:hypothetical protein N7454_006576 [Penicillium verhagenii]|nr:hypothetical protein N7454_006576 [Penicillium verhagenii]
MTSRVTELPEGDSRRSSEAPEEAVNGPMLADNFEDDTSDFESEYSDLTSLSSSILNYEYQNGRRYHSGRLSNYMMPNDEEEQDRMDLAHHIWLLLMKGELYQAPVQNPQKILDLGTGTGIWAIDIAEKFPEAHVIGTDISPIQPSWVCPNLEFVIEDFEDEWVYEPESFDFIHARLLAGCIADWPKFFQRCYECLKPGSYFEIQESAVWIWSDDGSCPVGSPLFECVKAIDIASNANGKPCNIYPFLKDWMIGAGFEDVQQLIYFLPYSPWPKDPYLKEIGKYQLIQAQQGVEAYSMRLFTDVLGWGEDVSRIFHAQAKQQLRDKHMHAYVKE